MSEARRIYTREFKVAAVTLINMMGQFASEAACTLDIAQLHDQNDTMPYPNRP